MANLTPDEVSRKLAKFLRQDLFLKYPTNAAGWCPVDELPHLLRDQAIDDTIEQSIARGRPRFESKICQGRKFVRATGKHKGNFRFERRSGPESFWLAENAGAAGAGNRAAGEGAGAGAGKRAGAGAAAAGEVSVSHYNMNRNWKGQNTSSWSSSSGNWQNREWKWNKNGAPGDSVAGITPHDYNDERTGAVGSDSTITFLPGRTKFFAAEGTGAMEGSTVTRDLSSQTVLGGSAANTSNNREWRGRGGAGGEGGVTTNHPYRHDGRHQGAATCDTSLSHLPDNNRDDDRGPSGNGLFGKPSDLAGSPQERSAQQPPTQQTAQDEQPPTQQERSALQQEQHPTQQTAQQYGQQSAQQAAQQQEQHPTQQTVQHGNRGLAAYLASRRARLQRDKQVVQGQQLQQQQVQQPDQGPSSDLPVFLAGRIPQHGERLPNHDRVGGTREQHEAGEQESCTSRGTRIPQHESEESSRNNRSWGYGGTATSSTSNWSSSSSWHNRNWGKPDNSRVNDGAPPTVATPAPTISTLPPAPTNPAPAPTNPTRETHPDQRQESPQQPRRWEYPANPSSSNWGSSSSSNWGNWGTNYFDNNSSSTRRTNDAPMVSAVPTTTTPATIAPVLPSATATTAPALLSAARATSAAPAPMNPPQETFTQMKQRLEATGRYRGQGGQSRLTRDLKVGGMHVFRRQGRHAPTSSQHFCCTEESSQRSLCRRT